MQNFKYISKVNEDYPMGLLFSEETVIEKLGNDGMDLLHKMLTSNPANRASANDLSKHIYFNSVRDELDSKYNYITIPEMICGDRRVHDDIQPSKVEYKGQINGSMMEILFDWLNEVVNEYRLLPDTLFYTRQLIDFYIKYTDSQILRNNIQLLGITALMIASKIFEIHSPIISDFTYITDNAYTELQIIEMELDILKTMRFQTMFPILSEYITYYNKNLLISSKQEAIILGKVLMISEEIWNFFYTHQIAQVLIYIVNIGRDFPKCLNQSKIISYEKLGSVVIKDIKRLLKKFPNLMNDKKRDIIENIIKQWDDRSLDIQPIKPSIKPPKLILIPEKPNNIKLSKHVNILFDGASDEDIDRNDVINFVNDYVMNQALKYINLVALKYDVKKFSKYFSFKFAPHKKVYILGKKKLQRITYNLGKLTVATHTIIHFNFVTEEIVEIFEDFLIKMFDETTYFSDEKLSGKISVKLKNYNTKF